MKKTIRLILAAVFVGIVAGDCMYEGTSRMTNTTWKIDSCTSCHCDSAVVTCSQTRCKDPQCDVSRGHSLVIPANECCPVCSMTLERHCVLDNEVVAHNTEWDGGNCTTCRCDDSAITCSLKRCERIQCGYGEVLRHLSGHCCPKCVSIEESCSFEEKSYRDGETWNPSECERAYCNKGEVVRHIAKCGNLVCGAGEQTALLEGNCCPTCVGRSCFHEGREYPSGNQFMDGHCRQCICQSGEVTCKNHFCNATRDDVDVGCAQGERRETREGECCSECVSTSDPCDYHGNRYFHGDLWSISKCEVAYCSHGNVRSAFVQCTPVQCKWNEKLVHNSCCPECVPVASSCRHNGFTYRHGDVWKGGMCKRCECLYGEVQCFTADCAVCPDHTVPVSVPGECCPDCQPVKCHSDCVTCDAPGYAHCTSCKRNRLLQGGKCVRRCLPGFYQDGKTCKACHSSCATCVLGESPSTCTSCEAGKMLQDGRCITSCQTGYFSQGNLCVSCPKGCRSCASPTSCSSCHDLTRVPQAGLCVQECGKGYFYNGGMCKACHSSCATCNGSSSVCSTCPFGMLFENGLCVRRCSEGHYRLSIVRCSACHPSCASCTGSLEHQCTACNPGSFLHNRRCLEHCPPAHYARGGQCLACHSGCLSCTGGAVSDCASCKVRSHVIQPTDSSSQQNAGTCQEECDIGHYLDGRICRVCHKSCGTCIDGNSCISCKHSSDVLVVNTQRFGQCVEKSRCVNMGLTADSTLLSCYNATALGYCSSQELSLSSGNCVSSCPSGTFSLTSTSGSICLPCSDHCSTCHSKEKCLVCKEGTYLSQLSSKCVESCEFGFYGFAGVCKTCPVSCGSCAIRTGSTQPVCTSCRDPDGVLQLGQCVTYCIQQFYPDVKGGNAGTPICKECDWSCTTCSGPSSRDCLDCMEDHKLQNGSCVAECSNGYYQSFDRCLQCSDEHCLSCSGSQHCSRCKEDYYLHGSTCTPSCSRGYFSDSAGRVCVRCPPHCLECSDQYTCTQCDAKTFLIDQVDPLGEETNEHTGRRRNTNRRTEACVRQCGRGYYGDKDTRQCEANRQSPVISIDSHLLVGIGSRALVSMITVNDGDTPVGDLLIHLVMEPANGWFELNNTRIAVETSFPYRKVVEGSFWFVHDQTRERLGVATFQATDRHLKSQVATLDVVAFPEFKPIVTKNKLLVIRSGESAKLGPRSCFDIQYEGNMNDITFTLVFPPKYGKIVKLPNYESPIKSFKVSDLRRDVLLYVTHGSITSTSTLHDVVTLQISDGYHVINKVIDVDILTKGNSSAILLAKKGTHVRRGGMTRITNQHLLTIATNVKDKSNIVYVIRPQRKKRGQVIMMVPEMSDAPVQHGIGINEWMRNSQGHYSSPPRIRFSQGDVDNGYIWYQDLATEEDEEEDIESFEFEVYDESLEPAVPLGGDVFQVNLVRENMEPPHLSPGMSSSPHMSANEGMVSVLHSGFLRYTDEDTPDRDILYNITRSLPSGAGILESVDHPHVPITLFTQSDIDSNKIIYRPPVGGIRSVQFATERSSGNDLQRLRYRQLKSPSSPSQSRPELSFQFTVSDGKHTLPPKNFTINLVSSSTAPPVFANQYPILDVSRGDSATIDERQLSVSDHDTPTSELVFTLVKSPRHGSLTRNNQGSQVLLGEGNTFTNADITQKTIRYVHNGDEFSLADQIQISVNDGIHSIVAVIQVSIAESDSPQAPPIADPFTELSLVVEESSEVALTRENLAFVDKESNDEQITYVIELEPVHGTLLKNVGQLAHGSSFTQADINQGRIKYRSRSEIGSLPVNDVMHFQVSDSSGNTLPNQEMQITIIQVRQHPPTVSTGRPVVVGEGREVRITREEMVISDVDTVDRDLIVNVLRKPTHGRIINKRNAESMHSYHYEDVWFTMQDLADGFIFYSHAPDLGGSEDSLTFRVSDGHSTSPVFAMHIEIQTSNARPILRTAPIICRNGHAILIKNISLAVEDDDTPSEDLVFTVTSRLLFGKLVKFKHKLPEDMLNGWQIGGMKGGNSMMKARLVTDLDVGSSFTYQDVLDQTVCYENTVPEEEEEEEEEHVRGSRRRRDTLGLILSDGSSHQNVEMFIDVEPTVAVVKEEPELMYIAPESDYEVFETEELRGSELVLEANTGMTVERGSITRITSNHLRMTGTDRIISYVITRDPNVGQLQYARNNIVANISADGDNEFTQEEIDQGSIRFNHPVSQGGGDVFFMFDVIGGPVDLRFDIHVNEDNIPPKLLTNNGLTVKEGGSKSITTRQLSASDESGRIFYEITQPTKLGRIESSDQPGRSIERFSQDDLVSGIVEYVHTSDTDRTEDQFMFSLSDGTNTVMHTFVIRVLPVDNSLPVLENLGIRVQEGVRKTITEFELKATDRDTSNNLIRFTIVAPSKHGTIDRTTSGTRYVPVTSFSMEDIYESRISYNHDGTNSLTDTFSFKVSDGTNEEFIISEEGSPVTTTEAQYFNIEVVPVDDGTPRLLTNRGLNHLEYMDNKALNVITKRALLTEDPDTEPDRIIYTITSDPRHGHLESTLNERQAIRSFTQADINTGIIRYVLSDLSTDVTRDSFMFNVRDSLPNVVTGNTFNIRWSVITFDSANYTVKEESGSIDIPVLRRGNLNQYAIVLCRTERGSATSSSDGTGPSSGSSDYVEHAGQVQFDEHETEKMCSIEIHDDSVFEGLESFSVELTMPTYALLGNITRTTISIDDQRDIPSLQFMETQYTVEERDTTVFIPIKRTGDVEKPVTVICYTESRSATGSRKGRIESGSDYKTRGRHSGESIVTFAPGVSQMNCDVRIIDDSIYEDSEEFGVRIIDASDGAEIGKFSEATVTITGPNDSPRVFLTDRQFVFAENAGTVDIPVHRSGPDLSRPTDVWCSTKANEPASAIAGQDFIATSTKITFRTDETAKICSLTILDDSQTPTVEGNETFVVYLNSVQKAHLGTPHEAQVIINDTQDDIPKFQFLVSSVDVKENSGVLSLPIQRIGDVSSRASVICYTRQNTATVDDDFTERPRTELSRIVFEEGQRLSLCNVSLTDDGIYESSEKFSVVLGSATGDQWYGASVGSNNHVTVTVTNDEDVPTLEFELEEYSIREPDTVEGTRQLSVKIVRTGDPSEVSRVRCSTRDGSAKSGTDYEPNSRLLRFEPHETSVTFTVNILSNEDTEWQETFLIVLGPQDPVNAVLGTKFQTTVTILDKDAAGSLVLPSTPVVVSLLHYDEVAVGLKSNPSPGYPLVCVTPCDPKYPNYVETQNLCEEAAINASAIRFSWEVAMPTEEEHGLPPFERITDSTPYTSVNTKVLDSIYFGRRFHVRCVAQAVDPVTRNGGTPLRSNVATIATDTGLCHNPIVSGSTRNFQAQSFIANLRYIPETEKQHPNTLHVSVKIPHQDGRLPLISTMPLNNLKLLLSRSIDRQQHVCSNLMYSEERNKSRKSDGTLSTSTEIGTNLGFVEATDYSKLSLGPGYDKPYQFDPNVREAKTIDLYKYLNLKSCIWQFDAYYHMNELIDYCNGKVQRDYQLRDAAESQLTVTVPLHVSYVYVTAPRGWGALEHHTDMQFSFRYKNVFWRTGIQTDGALTGRIQVLRIKIRDDGRLVIEFKTQAKFRGLFVPSHRTLPGRKSRVIPPEGMNIKFELTNLWSESTYDSPYQLWQAVSTYSRKDYSGEYAVEVLPCTVSPTQKWEVTPAGKAVPCTAYSPQEFKIPIMFQQTNRPVPVVYTLQTQFQLCNNEKVFMMDPKNYDQEIGDYDYKGSYTKGQTIFGRVLWTPDQDLKSAYRLQLEKVYLCTGKDGYVPYFDPTGTVYGQGPQYGCIEPSKNLQHRFLLLDRSNRDAEDRYFHDVPFDAYFASDRPDFASMAEIPGVDGFLIKVDGLYKVEAGHQWYIQVLYMIGSEDMVPRVKRSAFFDLSREKIFKRRRRSAYLNDKGDLSDRDILTAGWREGETNNNGTNMRGILIDRPEPTGANVPLIAGIACAVAVAILAFALLLCCCVLGRRRRRKRKEDDLEMVTRKTIALEAGKDSDDDDDVCSSDKKYNHVNTVNISSRKQTNQMEKNHNSNNVRVSNVRSHSSEVPLLTKSYKNEKQNNSRDSSKPLLKHSRRKNLDIQIVNNLKEHTDSGTEV